MSRAVTPSARARITPRIVAIAIARAVGIDLSRTTMYSTLEPCAFHGRTPPCARAIVDSGVRRIVTGILDPNPRVDGAGLRILREAGIEVIEDVCARGSPGSSRTGSLHHPHEPLRRARALLASPGASPPAAIAALRDHYGIGEELAADVVSRALAG